MTADADDGDEPTTTREERIAAVSEEIAQRYGGSGWGSDLEAAARREVWHQNDHTGWTFETAGPAGQPIRHEDVVLAADELEEAFAQAGEWITEPDHSSMRRGERLPPEPKPTPEQAAEGLWEQEQAREAGETPRLVRREDDHPPPTT